MARQSADSLAVATVSIPVRPEPPLDLTDNQRKIWEAVTNTKPPEWFEADSFPILKAYCIASDLHDRISHEIEQKLEVEEFTDRHVLDLLKIQDQQAKLIASLAVKMRLTQQSRYTPKAASTANRKSAGGQKPWDN